MDPCTAIGLVSDIISFIGVGVKVFNNARQIHNSTFGALDDTISQEYVVGEMKRFSTKLLAPDSQYLSPDERDLCGLAGECRDLAGEIIKLLEKIKPKDPNSWVDSFKSAIKNGRYEKERLDLQQRLADCRSQLDLQLNYITRSEFKDRLGALVENSKEDSTKLGQIQNQVKQLREGLTITSISPEAQAQLSELFQMSEESFDKLICERLLDSLAFSEMHGRFDAVQTAHFKTFEWIFDERVGMDYMNLPKNRIHESFVSWLSSGHGTYHVSGKLGSGKSTLMKFLYQHDSTKIKLAEWAGDRKLVMASFFFWKPGSSLQKSFDGLLRSLLYECLNSARELVPHILKEPWNQLKSMPRESRAGLHFSPQEIHQFFDRLLNSQASYEKYAFCFFIDGLDEYEGSAQNDATDVVQKLCSWSETISGNVKICASSREYNVFMNHFPAERRLRLQDLTRDDMDGYIRDKIDFIRDTEEANKLSLYIRRKADGIFLWVALVIKRLRELREDGASLSRLQEEVESFPQGLDELFHHIFDSLHPSDRKRAYQTFAILLKLKEYKLAPPLRGYAFLDQYREDLGFEERDSFLDSLPNHPESHWTAKARKMQIGYCRGLIEPTKDSWGFYSETVLSFTHRSVPEFVSSPAFRRNMDMELEGFRVENAISQLFLAGIWAMDIKSLARGRLDLTCFAIFNMRHKSGIGGPPFLYEEYFASGLNRIENTEIRYRENLKTIKITHGDNGERNISHFLTTTVNTCTAKITNPLHIAAYIGNSAYVEWKLKQNLDVLKDPFQHSILLYCLAKPDPKIDINGRLSILDLILKLGLNPQTAMSFWSCEINTEDRFQSMTIWQHVILGFIGTTDCPLELECKRLIGGFLEKFLQYGADPFFYITLPTHERSGTTPFLLTVGAEKRHVWASGKINKDFIPRQNSHSNGSATLSLNHLVMHWDLENKQRIVSLIDRNTRYLQGEMPVNAKEVDKSIELPDSAGTAYIKGLTSWEEKGYSCGYRVEATRLAPPKSAKSPSWSFGVVNWKLISAVYLLGILSTVLISRLRSILFS